MSGQMDYVQVHQVTVVGQQIVGGSVQPAGVVELQHHAAAILHDAVFTPSGLVDVFGVIARRGSSTTGRLPKPRTREQQRGGQHGVAGVAAPRGMGLAPGGNCASRTPAPTSAIMPNTSSSPRGSRSAPTAFCMPSTRVESAGTGTASVPLPSVPSTSTRTFHDPVAISQRLPV